jgi:HAD superfamily hydrolase (TIGR01509 family)
MNARRAVVFDLYETLVTEVHVVTAREASGRSPADRLGLDRDLFDSLWRARKHERMTQCVAYADVLAEACVRIGRWPDAEAWRRIEELAIERVAAKTSVLQSVDPAVSHTLDQLKQAGFALGLVSNCSVEEVEGWPSSPLAAHFDSAVFSYDVGLAKPDPAIYQLACERLGVPAGSCVFVGDGGSDELGGAAAVGMRPFAARWHVDRWPTEVRRQVSARTRGFPTLAAPADLLGTLAG